MANSWAGGIGGDLDRESSGNKKLGVVSQMHRKQDMQEEREKP